MTTITTSIRMVPPRLFKPGTCCICGQPALLKWIDLDMIELGGNLGALGDCCHAVHVATDRFLNAVLARPLVNHYRRRV